MKINRPSFFMLSCIILLITLGAMPSHAIPMKITDGNITLGSNDPVPITGYVDLIAPDAFSMFIGVRTDIYLDDYTSTFSIVWEGGPPTDEQRLELYYGPDSVTYIDYPGFGFGYVDYVAEYYDPDLRWVSVASWEAMQINLSFYDYPDIGPLSLNLAATAPVPEPSTIVLIGLGLTGLVGLGRKRMKI